MIRLVLTLVNFGWIFILAVLVILIVFFMANERPTSVVASIIGVIFYGFIVLKFSRFVKELREEDGHNEKCTAILKKAALTFAMGIAFLITYYSFINLWT